MASRLEAGLKGSYPALEVELIEGKNGVFDVEQNGKLIFSKSISHRFPDSKEIAKKLSGY